MRKFKDVRDEAGRVHFPTKQAITDYIPAGKGKPFQTGDEVYYAGRIKVNYGKYGVLGRKLDAFGFEILFKDGTKATTTVGALQFVKAKAEPKPKEAKPKEAAPKPAPVITEAPVERQAEASL